MRDEVQYEVSAEVKEAFRNLRLKRKLRWVVFGVDEAKKGFFVDHRETDR